MPRKQSEGKSTSKETTKKNSSQQQAAAEKDSEVEYTPFDSFFKDFLTAEEIIIELINKYLKDFIPTVTNHNIRKLPQEFVTSALGKRTCDLVWEVKVGGKKYYILLLIEIQSRVDLSMPLRIFVYTGLIYQELQKRGKLSFKGGLPLFLPVVFYTGKANWTAKLSFQELFKPQPPANLLEYIPRQKYVLIDVERMAPMIKKFIDSNRDNYHLTYLDLLFLLTPQNPEESLSCLLENSNIFDEAHFNLFKLFSSCRLYWFRESRS